MELQESAVAASRASASPEVRFQPPNPAVMAEVERLLTGRTRDIRLRGELGRLFQERSWSRTAKIIRAWMTWVALLDVLTLGLNAILLPKAVVLSMLPPACILPPAALATAFVWRKPRGVWLLKVSLLAGLFLILLSVALVGVSAGGEFHERHLNIMLFVAITAIIIFAVPLTWTVTVASFALALYLIFQLRNPSLDEGSAVAGTLFFASGIIATVVARRTMTILAQKTFLLELRDKRRVVELADANARLERLAKTDPLTGIANRRWMMETLNRLWSADADRPPGNAMLMCDIDDFKNLNDRLGHAEGDRCLVKVAGIIQSSVRRNRDHVARYGGEEFLVVLPGADERAALATAERIRASVEAASLPNPASRVSPYVTLSVGVAAQAPGEEIIAPEKLQNQADVALYLAKQAGRNRVILYQPDLPTT
ncbi:GGDEF domain-containing protein [Sinorhizobium garamanticum]|uniref:diguanylate cyclase n=1 Tax=Sinorhizobium garamanticum TaxID=680247 RepID=A0ABY8DFN2_9HYPH|nr:GGDEF domain-containing protein [Sinorhizobium garamanticum]WEX89703.1 GGDEF domain-containing protein [Sinorhizobium garamanticum]